jgi:hypothetical protein
MSFLHDFYPNNEFAECHAAWDSGRPCGPLGPAKNPREGTKDL